MSGRCCEFCKGPMPPEGGKAFCSALCSARSFAGFTRDLFTSTVAERIAKRKAASKAVGQCDWCGARSKHLYCEDRCQQKRFASDNQEKFSERARQRSEARAAAPCLDCSKPIERIVYRGRGVFYCEQCAQRRAAESHRETRRRLSQPNVPLSRGLRRVLEAARQGARTNADFQLALGQQSPGSALDALIKKGLLAIRRVPGKKSHVYVPAEDVLELDGALLEVAQAEEAYRATWERVLASRAALDRLLLAIPAGQALPPLSRHTGDSQTARCLRLLESAPERSFDLKAVALALGCSRKTVGRPLSLLCRDGEIERVELGVYRAKSKARARAA